MKKMKVKIPFALDLLLVEKYKYTYIHDYSNSPIFRISSPGFYTLQHELPKGQSYICIEIPDPELKYDKKLSYRTFKEIFKNEKN